ncbi:unnamed protein product [Ceutorhynchus assimilis]|uniref:DUF4773 domain-containing protein n=1 Tax=Ceutorhynchus assimilis TaxID=467358 RepID=A0A9N9QIQ5_9CUCU|nr:unnamed protein product [Ceutorhynchus assimilis]
MTNTTKLLLQSKQHCRYSHFVLILDFHPSVADMGEQKYFFCCVLAFLYGVSFSLKIQKYLIYVIVILLIFIRPKNARQQRYVGLSGCDIISPLEYECCAGVNLANVPQSDYCLHITAVPNELTLNLDLKVNGNSFYNGKIDPSIAPICPPPSPLCLAINHVNIASREICTKLTIGPLTLVKFPCAGITDGQIVVTSNNYVRK